MLLPTPANQTACGYLTLKGLGMLRAARCLILKEATVDRYRLTQKTARVHFILNMKARVFVTLCNSRRSEPAAAHPAAELAGHPRRRRMKMVTSS